MKTNNLRFLVFAGIFLFCAVAAQALAPVIGGYKVYYGSLHNHCGISDGSGTPEDAYNYAKSNSKLDFFGLADHSTVMTSDQYTSMKNAANTFNQDGVFTAFYGFEWTALVYGHVAVINTEDFCSSLSVGKFTGLVSWLNSRDGIAFFNHPGWDWSAFNEFNHFTTTPSAKFVGVELWNGSDGFNVYYDNDGYFSNDGNKGYYDEALVRKWNIGASGAEDNHGTNWGNAVPYRMGVLANNLTRSEIYEALKARRFFSTLDKDLALSFRISGAEMGSTVPGGTVRLVVEATDGTSDPLARVTVKKNGSDFIIKSSFSSSLLIDEYITCNSGDYLYVVVNQLDGDRAISSPIFISGTANQPPTVSLTAPANGASFVTGQAINIAATASDIDGTITKVEFLQGSVLLGTDTDVSYGIQWIPTAAGTYSLTAKAYDNLGAYTVSAPVNITVDVATNQPPVVTLTSPANGATFAEGAAILVAATADDPDGSIDRVEFYQDNTPLGSDALSPYEFQWTEAAVGTYSLTAKAYDNMGAFTVSAPVNITVTAPVSGVRDVRISGTKDDAEQYQKGGVLLYDSDIDLVYDSKTSGNQTVGLYFRTLDIPAGVTITSAYIRFTALLQATNKCSLQIKGQLSANPAEFLSTSKNLSSRIKTLTTINWTPGSWNTDECGSAQQTPDLKSIVQEIVNLSSVTTNNLVILITGTGTRTAYSFDNQPLKAATLHVEYTSASAQSQETLKSTGVAVKNPSLLTGQPVQEVNVQCYPNPVTDHLNIRVSGDAVIEELEIYSVHSVLIGQRKITGQLQETTMNCIDLVPGTYIVAVKTSRGIYPLKFVRQ